MNLQDLVDYEISGSWWAGWLPFGHEMTARYMVWKTKRKMRRYERFIKIRNHIQLMKSLYK